MNDLKIIPIYDDSVSVIPTRVIECLGDATGDDMAVLLAALRCGESFDADRISKEFGIGKRAINSALRFWEKNGIIRTEKNEEEKSARSVPFGKKKERTDEAETKEPARPQRTEVPPLTTDEAAAFLEGNKRVKMLISDVEREFGKVLTRAEVNKIIGLCDHLSLEPEYVMLLVGRAKQKNKGSVRTVELMAFEMFDKGITTYSALVEELSAIEKAESFEGKVRKIFGLGQRSLIGREQEFIRTWCSEWGYGEDMVGEAYEITVTNTEKSSLSYANAVLQNWHDHGVRTVEEARIYQKEHPGREKKKKGAPKSGGAGTSFDTDDFFEAALKRSYKKE